MGISKNVKGYLVKIKIAREPLVDFKPLVREPTDAYKCALLLLMACT